jgi:Zn-dependent peptidase ImmA (M78 family)
MQFLKLCQQYHRLEMWCGEVIPPCLPEGSGNAACYTYVDAEALAKQVRDQLELGDRPGLSLLTVLEEVCGVKVFHLDFNPTGTAASCRSDTFGVAVLLNKGNVRWRRNFDLAHELFHLLTWHVFSKAQEAGATSACVSGREEQFATCFARNLLMPADVVKKAFSDKRKDGKLSFEAVFDIARQFDVSVEALLRHMSFLGIVDRGAVDNVVDRAKLLAPMLEDRQESTKPPTWPERYKSLAMKALRHGSISLGKFAEFLEISRHEAMKYVEQEITDDEEVPVTPS